MAKILIPVERYVGGEEYSVTEWIPATKATCHQIRTFMYNVPLTPREARHCMLHLARKRNPWA